MTTYKHKTREDWLRAAYELLAPILLENCTQDLPEKIHILTSWPHGSKKAIGMQFGQSWTQDKSIYIAISPVLGGDRVEMLGVLLHEMIHALGISKHGKDFKKVALACGLEGEMKATTVGKELSERLLPLVTKLGDYPHTSMNPPTSERKPAARKQILKFVSPVDPDYTCWLTPAQAERIGPPVCPISNQPMEAA